MANKEEQEVTTSKTLTVVSTEIRITRPFGDRETTADVCTWAENILRGTTVRSPLIPCNPEATYTRDVSLKEVTVCCRVEFIPTTDIDAAAAIETAARACVAQATSEAGWNPAHVRIRVENGQLTQLELSSEHIEALRAELGLSDHFEELHMQLGLRSHHLARWERDRITTLLRHFDAAAASPENSD